MKKTLQYLKNELAENYPETEIDGLARIIFEKVCGWSFSEQVLKRDSEISLSRFIEIQKIVERLKRSEPIQYIFGETEFYGLKMNVEPGVLIPRPETEELVEWILQSGLPDHSNILDIGTGSGCIALALKQNMPRATVWAMDISEDALKIAKQNALKNGLKINFIQADILGVVNEPAETFDVIVSNPPYVREMEKSLMHQNVLNFEPGVALFVPDEDPLVFYRAIAGFAFQKLRSGGRLFLEINENLAEETKTALQNLGLSNVEIRKDINGKNRMISACKKQETKG